MARANYTFVALLLLALLAISMLQTEVLASQPGHRPKKNGYYGPGSVKRHQCPSRCNKRCSKTHHLSACMMFCQQCCKKCLCVPPGYYGHKQVCPCYNNWKTKEGGPKCP